MSFNGGDSTNSASMTQNVSKVTPELMRGIMGSWPDPADKLFKKHIMLLYKRMELRARKKEMDESYCVTDNTEANEKNLQQVFIRLVQWLRGNKFMVSPSSEGPRGFIVSWDPLKTPRSITEHERADPQSVAVIRSRCARRNQSIVSGGQSLFDIVPSSSIPLIPQERRRDEDVLGDLLAATSLTTSPQTASHRFQHHSRYEERSVPRHLVDRTRQMAQRAASVAGADKLSRELIEVDAEPTTTTAATTLSSDEQSREHL